MKKIYLSVPAPLKLKESNPFRKLFSLFVLVPALALLFSCEKIPEEQVAPIAGSAQSADATATKTLGINVVLNTSITDKILNDLKAFGTVGEVIPKLNALTMKIPSDKLASIQKLSFVSTANPDATRNGAPVDAVAVADFSTGLNTWNLDAVNVTDYNPQFGPGRTIQQDGTGVYIGVLDTGLLDSWRQYFPQERIATQYARSFGGGGGERGNVSEQLNKWEHDQNSHGTHVTSTILGFNLGGTSINGVAPKAKVIPVKVLNQNGSGWSSVIAQGIVYIADLKAGALSNSPVVINMSLGGPVLDAIEKAAIDYAVSKGVIIVASAGNSGLSGMGYPGAYQPVISVASAGLIAEFSTPTWWYTLNVPDPTDTDDFYISGFSSRKKTGQDLDVTAPGSNVVGPYQLNSGKLSYFYLSGTSMASPHVAGIVALMAQKNKALTAAQAESTLESVAIPMATPVEAGAGFITADAAVNATATVQ